jgi:hypothetical protein
VHLVTLAISLEQFPKKNYSASKQLFGRGDIWMRTELQVSASQLKKRGRIRCKYQTRGGLTIPNQA